MRIVEGLLRAERLPSKPACIPTARPKGAKAKGLAYERAVGKMLRRQLPELVSHQWFAFADQNGRGFCQTDHYVVLDGHVVLFECKLTETPAGFNQIDLLYRPVLLSIYGLPVTGIMVCKHLVSRSDRLIGGLAEAPLGQDSIWHLLP